MLYNDHHQEKESKKFLKELDEIIADCSSDLSLNYSRSLSFTLDEKNEFFHVNVDLVCENEDQALFGFLLSELSRGNQRSESIRLNFKEEPEFECEEIISILQKNLKTAENSPRNALNNHFSKSAPQFTQLHIPQPKKISLVGRVLCGGEKNNSNSQHVTSETSSGYTSGSHAIFRTIPIPIPMRVSKPEKKNMERLTEAVNCDNKINIGNSVNPEIHKSDNI